MALRASSVITSDAYLQVKRGATQLKINLQTFSAFMATNNLDYDYIKNIYLTLTRSRDKMAELGVIPGLDAYAKDQEDDQLYDFDTEFSDLDTAIDSAIAWVDLNVPTSATVQDPVDWEAGTSMIINTFTPVQMAGLKTAIDAVITEIV